MTSFISCQVLAWFESQNCNERWWRIEESHRDTEKWDRMVWALRWRSQSVLEAPGVRCIQLDSGMGLLRIVEKRNRVIRYSQRGGRFGQCQWEPLVDRTTFRLCAGEKAKVDISCTHCQHLHSRVEKGFAIMSLTWRGSAISMGLRHRGPWGGHVHIISAQSLRPSWAPHNFSPFLFLLGAVVAHVCRSTGPFLSLFYRWGKLCTEQWRPTAWGSGRGESRLLCKWI